MVLEESLPLYKQNGYKVLVGNILRHMNLLDAVIVYYGENVPLFRRN